MDENAMIFQFKSTPPDHLTYMKVKCLKRIYAQITTCGINIFTKYFCPFEGKLQGLMLMTSLNEDKKYPYWL